MERATLNTRLVDKTSGTLTACGPVARMLELTQVSTRWSRVAFDLLGRTRGTLSKVALLLRFFGAMYKYISISQKIFRAW